MFLYGSGDRQTAALGLGGSSFPAPPPKKGLELVGHQSLSTGSPGTQLLGSGCPRPAPPARGYITEALPAPSAAPDRGWCSTWGAGHFSTFDGHVYDFEGTCNYVFVATCKDVAPTFSVQLRRGPSGNISRIVVELGASVVTVQGAISIKDVG